MLLAASQAVTAHFGLKQPQWRTDTLSEEAEEKYSQWNYPCELREIFPLINTNTYTRKIGAGVPYGEGNTTDWPLDGGLVELSLHHPWTYLFINLGLGENTTNFNISLTPELWNATGRGTLCIDKLAVPEGIADGTRASIQVVTSGNSGSALYNCADIRFSKDAKRPGNCTTQGVTVATVGQQQGSGGNATCDGKDQPAKESGKPGTSAAAVAVVNGGVLSTVAGLAALFTLGLEL